METMEFFNRLTRKGYPDYPTNTCRSDFGALDDVAVTEGVKAKSDIVEKVLLANLVETSSTVMAELLMDTDITTYKMFEDLASAYLEANPAARAGIDKACSVLTGYSLPEIAEKIINRSSEE